MAERPRHEVAEIFERYQRHLGSDCQGHPPPWSWEQRAVVERITACRTARLGGHIDACDACGHQRISYNSCRNRHCPKCQGSAQADWLEARQADVLPVPYAHVVFTIPQLLGPLALQNPSLLYDLLLRTSARTLQEIARNPKHLGARLGFFVILHTWGQTLIHHPHVHCVVPAGGLSEDGRTWRACRPGFFLPVRVLSRLFRGKFVAALQDAFQEGRLELHGRLACYRSSSALDGVILAGYFNSPDEDFTVDGLVVSGLDGLGAFTDVRQQGYIRYNRCYAFEAGRRLSHFEAFGSTWWEEM